MGARLADVTRRVSLNHETRVAGNQWLIRPIFDVGGDRQDVFQSAVSNPSPKAVQQVGVPHSGASRKGTDLVVAESATARLVERANGGYRLAHAVSFSEHGEGAIVVVGGGARGHRHGSDDTNRVAWPGSLRAVRRARLGG